MSIDYLPSLKRDPYCNERVFAPNGDLMFRCSTKKTDWYLNRGLAVVIEATPPRSIRLLFEPNGNGHHDFEYEISERQNICVVCGTSQNLTRHHVVPKCFRRYMPLETVSHQSYDVLVLCVNCHIKYEVFAEKKKKDICRQYGVAFSGSWKRRPAEKICCRAAKLLYRHREYLDPFKILKYEYEIRYHFGYVNEALIEKLASIKWNPDTDHIPFGKSVMERVADIEEFVKDWRRHFVDTMQPAYLHPLWEVDGAVVRIPVCA